MAMEKEITNFQAKYGKRTASFGFTQVPNLLLQEKKELGLTNSESIMLSYLMTYGRATEIMDIICPSLKEMAQKTGLSTATIHKAKNGLVKKGFIKIIKKNNVYQTNSYSLLPARKKLNQLATKKIQRQFWSGKMEREKYDELMGDHAIKAQGEFLEMPEGV